MQDFMIVDKKALSLYIAIIISLKKMCRKHNPTKRLRAALPARVVVFDGRNIREKTIPQL